MKKGKVIYVMLILLIVVSCNNRKRLSNPSSYREIITSYSSNHLPVSSPITVRFVNQVTEDVKKTVPNKLIQLTPKVKGKLTWLNKYAVQFTPKQKLASNKSYKVSVDLGKVFKGINDTLKNFEYELRTKKQDFKFGSNYLTPQGKKHFKYTGTILSTDVIDSTELKKVVSATIGNQNFYLKWKRRYSQNSFTIDSIKRGEDPQALTLSISGNKVGIDITRTKTVKIPALGDFKLVEAKAIQAKSQSIKLVFSDFINATQSFEGIISCDKPNYHLSVKENIATLQFKEQIEGEVNIKIDRGLLNANGNKLQSKEERKLFFEAIKPGVKLLDNNTILPYGNQMPLAFETVNLNAIDIRVTKIYQKNVLQFLQKNELNETSSTKYVGEEILTKKITLNKQANYGLWSKQLIDLRPLIQKDPTALYRIELGFRKSYSTFPCAKSDDVTDPSTLGIEEEILINKDNFWQEFDRKHAYNSASWEERENPCASAYYEKKNSWSSSYKVAKTNILGSDLGVIVKKDKQANFLVAVTSIKTTQPIPGAKVELISLQNTILKTAFTTPSGIIRIPKTENPFLVRVSNGNQRGYLKLNDWQALSLSQFNVDGTSNEQDVKGLLYAERGVWRPGDSIFVNFILEDKFDNLPNDYPIGFEFINPKWQKVERRVVTNNLNGHYKFWTKTDVADITGNYTVKAIVGNSTFTKTIKVETIRPNRLKMKLSLGDGDYLYTDKIITPSVSSKWLHGAPANKLRHKVDVTYSKGYTSFKNYKDYTFEAPYRNFETRETLFFDELSDSNGVAKKEMKINKIEHAPGFLNAHFKIKVFEKGGRFSIDQTSKILMPYNKYVGVQSNINSSVKIGTPLKLNIVNVNREQKITKDDVIVSIHKLSYNWWYDMHNSNNKYLYKGELTQKPIHCDTLSITNKVISYRVLSQIQEDGQYLITIKNSEGHTTGKMVSYYKYNRYEPKASLSGTKELSLSLSKETCIVGDKTILTIPTANKGKVFLSLEDGQKILKTQWVQITGKQTKVELTITESMAPYVYAHVTYIQPHDHKENDLPLRMYGVVPIKVEAKNAHLRPEINMKDEIRPNAPYTINIKEKYGFPMTYTLAVVDEGLLDITHHKTPNVWRAFNAKPALEVKTWDVYDRVIKAEKFNVRNLLSIGGDGEGEGANDSPEGVKLNRFKPVVKFIGPFYCPAGGKKTHVLNMPNYVGSVKVVAIAAHNRSYGQTSKKVRVANPLMVLGTLPRILGPNETIALPVDVFAMKNNVKNVSISVKTNNLMSIEGVSTKKMTFSKVGDKQETFTLKTKELFGVANVLITAKSGSEVATYTVRLAVRPPNSSRVETYSELLSTGAKFEKSIAPYGYKGTNNFTVELSTIPSINLKKRLDYLVHYPYGCVEQTTSSVFPQLHLTTLMDLSAKRKRAIEANIKAGIKRLRRFQTSEGGLGYWPGARENNNWGTNYAGHFLLEAKAVGFEVNDDFLAKWINYQTQQANQWENNSFDELTQAYRLYLLAKAGEPNIGAMNRLRVNIDKQSLASFYLAGAYYGIGQSAVGNDLIKTVNISNIKADESYRTFGSGTRNRAIMLQILAELRQNDKAWILAKQLAEELNTSRYMSTQTTAYSLLAMAEYVQSTSLNAFTKVNIGIGKNKKTISFKKSIYQYVHQSDSKEVLTVENLSGKPLFMTIIQNGIPNATDSVNENLKLNMQVAYTNSEGKKIDVTNLIQGEDFIAEVTLTNPTKEYYRHMSLTQIFPSGWEIHNAKINGDNLWRNQVTFEDTKDDRVNSFYNLAGESTKKFKVFLNASYKGRYYLPAVQAEAMYNHEIRARKHGKWINVN